MAAVAAAAAAAAAAAGRDSKQIHIHCLSCCGPLLK